jgi:hypothetical protein
VRDCYSSQFSSTSSFVELKQAYTEGKLSAVMNECFIKARAKEELFSVSAQGLDYQNLALDPSYKEVLEKYRQRLHQWRKMTGDKDYVPYPNPND